MEKQTRYIIRIALFGALGVLGGFLKVPGPVGSIALDSWPGYFTAAYFSPWLGGTVGFIGHLGSAWTGGFPLSYLHFVVAILMFFWCFLFGYVVRMIDRWWSLILASLIAIGLNGIASPFLLVPFGWPREYAIGAMVVLLVASTLNVLVASIVTFVVSRARIGGL